MLPFGSFGFGAKAAAADPEQGGDVEKLELISKLLEIIFRKSSYCH
jgi:hypothetical protein